MGFSFDKAEIKKQCVDFFSLYNDTKIGVREMCIRKRIHTHAVADNCYRISSYLRLDEYDRDMAWVIGELHDFARFGQAVVTGSFRDTAEYDHAKMAVSLLFKHKMIEDIIPDYYGISQESDPERYDLIKSRNIDAMLEAVVSDESVDISRADLSVYAEDYLLRIGMDEKSIELLREIFAG